MIKKQQQQQTKKHIDCSLQYPLIFLHILVFCVGWCLKLTACGWLKVSSEKLILSKTVTTPKNQQLKSSRNVTNSRGKAVLSFCFPCSFTIHVNSKLMRTIFYSHNKFTNYIFHNSPDILARLINLAWKELQLKEIGWVHSFLRIPLNTAESDRTTESANFGNALRLISFSV